MQQVFFIEDLSVRSDWNLNHDICICSRYSRNFVGVKLQQGFYKTKMSHKYVTLSKTKLQQGLYIRPRFLINLEILLGKSCSRDLYDQDVFLVWNFILESLICGRFALVILGWMINIKFVSAIWLLYGMLSFTLGFTICLECYVHGLIVAWNPHMYKTI